MVIDFSFGTPEARRFQVGTVFLPSTPFSLRDGFSDGFVPKFL